MEELGNAAQAMQRVGCDQHPNIPLFDRPPFYFRNVLSATFVCETSSAAAAAALPDGLRLPQGTSIAAVTFNRFDLSTSVHYSEVIFGIHCLWENEPVVYYHTILFDNTAGLITAREPYAFGRLFANIQVESENGLTTASAERPTGTRCVAGAIHAHNAIDPPPSLPAVTLRVTPGPLGDDALDHCELLMVRIVRSTVASPEGMPDAYSGPASITLDASSVHGGIHLPMLRMVSASSGRYNVARPFADVLMSSTVPLASRAANAASLRA